MEAELLGARLSDLRAKAVVAVLADTLADVESETFHHTVFNMEPMALVHQLAAMLGKVETERLDDTSRNVQATAQGDTLSDMLVKVIVIGVSPKNLLTHLVM